jgi:hypothetical protein
MSREASNPTLAKKKSATPEGEGKTAAFYKKLDLQFHSGGFDLRQVDRGKRWAIYAKTRSECPSLLVFEVIRVRKRSAFVVDGRSVEAAEVFPPAEAWGCDGFTCHDKEAAYRKLKEILR